MRKTPKKEPQTAEKKGPPENIHFPEATTLLPSPHTQERENRIGGERERRGQKKPFPVLSFSSPPRLRHHHRTTDRLLLPLPPHRAELNVAIYNLSRPPPPPPLLIRRRPPQRRYRVSTAAAAAAAAAAGPKGTDEIVESSFPPPFFSLLPPFAAGEAGRKRPALSWQIKTGGYLFFLVRPLVREK